jgi:hypothetical protein
VFGDTPTAVTSGNPVADAYPPLHQVREPQPDLPECLVAGAVRNSKKVTCMVIQTGLLAMYEGVRCLDVATSART